MSLEDGVCGTGGWSGPLPGDPNNDSILTATAVYGGVQVAWTYPTVNPSAVAHTLLYRGITALSSEAMLHRTVTGDSYFDIANPEDAVTYFYWIKIVSVYGTVGPLIGPASVSALPTVLQLMALLTGKIDDGLLATSLKSDIASIASLGQELDLEIQSRLDSNVALGNALASVQTETSELTTYILNETTQRTTADSAQVNAINAIAVGQGDNAAAVVNEAAVRLAADSAMATDISTLVSRLAVDGDVGGAIIINQSTATTALDNADTALQTALGKNKTFYAAAEPVAPAVITEGDLWVDTDDGNKLYRWNGLAWENIADTRIVSTAETVSLLQASVDSPTTGLNTKASIGYVDTAEANAISASATASEALVASAITDNNVITNAAIQTETTARINADTALAGQITTAESNLNGSIAQVQTNLNTEIGIVDGELTNIGALYTAKVNVNGLIGGFGIYNDGLTVQMGFDVDSFWVGRTGPDQVKPFIISGGVVYMANAMIANGSIDNLKIGNVIQSNTYVAGSAGWKIDKAGSMEMNVGTFRGSVNTGSYTGYAWPPAGQYGAHISASGILVGNANNGTYFQVTSDGNIYAPQFSIVNGAATFAGNLSAASGTFSGTLTANAINAVNTVNIAGDAVTVPRFVEASNSLDLSIGTVNVLTAPSITLAVAAPVLLTINVNSDGAGQPTLIITRNGTTLKNFQLDVPFSYDFLDTPGVGTFTYSVDVSSNAYPLSSVLRRTLFVMAVKK